MRSAHRSVPHLYHAACRTSRVCEAGGSAIISLGCDLYYAAAREVREVWSDFQSSRARDAVYGYLAHVFAIVEHYKMRRKTRRLLQHAFEFADLLFEQNADPFTAIIRCTSDDAADSKMVSKWTRALRFVARSKKPQTGLKTFMKNAGGINACAYGYTRLKRRNRATPESLKKLGLRPPSRVVRHIWKGKKNAASASASRAYELSNFR